ncbi:MAG: glutaredoxin family protein [Planctomycetaceae bacterium]
MDVLLYSRRGCHLCEAAEEAVADLLPGARVVDVAGDPELERAFGTRVPVLVIGGREVAAGRIDAAALATALARGVTDPD